jgi:hypothetical protein
LLPNRIFFTGVPGSRWSGIAQQLESLPGFNTSDRTLERDYSHHNFSGHKGAYFGSGMEFEPILSEGYVDRAHLDKQGTRIIKSHDWAYVLDDIEKKFPNDWIMLVYRQDLASYTWWHEAGGFQIKYPNYSAYKDSTNMLAEISKQNSAILDYSYRKNAKWSHFTSDWIKETFGYNLSIERVFTDILVTIVK